MDTPLLQTKLYIPTPRAGPAMQHRSSLIPRPHLLERLNEGLPGKLTLISAPAGFGKTTLVSDWLAHLKLPAAWLSLDEDDNDLGRFFSYLVAALQTILPDVGSEVLALLHSSPLPSSHTLLTLLLNDLTALAQKSVLVLDDYHTIENETINQALTFFLDHLPPALHLVIISRVDPTLPLPRLRAKGQLNELRSAELRFTLAETADFLAQMTGLSLAPAEIAALDRRAEGWIAGLQMAALSLRQREAAAVTQFIAEFSGSHRYIMDYLVDEVLRQQPAEVQTFLLYTSILDRLCASLGEAILRDGAAPDNERDTAPLHSDPSRAQALLAYMEQANLFIAPLDEQRQWYRYHPLFAELLRHRLNQTYPDQVAGLHLRASRWYEQAGSTGSAIQHALTAKMFGRAACLVEQAAPAMIQRSELARLLAWLGMLPDIEIQARPLLGLYYGWGLFLNGQFEQAATRLEAVEALLERDETQWPLEVQGHIAALRAHLARESGDFAAMIDLSRQALAHLPGQESLLRGMVTFNLAMAHYLQGEFEPASHLFTETITTGQTAQLTASSLAAIYLHTRLLRANGALQGALQLCQERLAMVARRGWHNLPAVGFVDVAFGDLLRERNQLSAAAEYLEKGIRLGQEGGRPHIVMIGNIWLAWLRHTQGDVTGSHEAIGTALRLAQQYEAKIFRTLPYAACCQARLWIAQGHLAAANRWAESSGLTERDTPITYLLEVEYLTLARLWIAQGHMEAAEALLLRLHQAATAAKRDGTLIEILVLQAITFAAQKRSEEALPALAQALSLAEPEGFVRVFLDEGAPMAELLRQAVAQKLRASYALELLEALGEVAAAPQPLVEPLSERELEVLRLIAAGYSNQEIAQELVVAVSTVKKHISNTFGKLAVGKRTQAVAKARELGLL
jgi:LuxR family maltose regulon positive regulatory protein